jgi:hypothetical protein
MPMLVPGNLRQVYETFHQTLRSWTVGDVVGQGDRDPLAARIVPGVFPRWYILCVLPAHERIAGAHLIGRRFGIFIPEYAERYYRRGERVTVLRPMFPGYVFVFMWHNPQNFHRVVSCPGVMDFLRYRDSLQPAIVADTIIDMVRIIENKLQPIVVDHEAVGVKKGRRGFRRFRKTVHNHQVIDDAQIISVHTWSALRDGAMSLDGHTRNQLLVKALGVA